MNLTKAYHRYFLQFHRRIIRTVLTKRFVLCIKYDCFLFNLKIDTFVAPEQRRRPFLRWTYPQVRCPLPSAATAFCTAKIPLTEKPSCPYAAEDLRTQQAFGVGTSRADIKNKRSRRKEKPSDPHPPVCCDVIARRHVCGKSLQKRGVGHISVLFPRDAQAFLFYFDFSGRHLLRDQPSALRKIIPCPQRVR